MISDMIYIASLYASHLFIVLATIMLLVRVIHPCISMYLINSFFNTTSSSHKYYSRLVDNSNLAPNAKLYGLLLLIALVETTAIKFLPWVKTPFLVNSGGILTTNIIIITISSLLCWYTIFLNIITITRIPWFVHVPIIWLFQDRVVSNTTTTTDNNTSVLQ